MAKFNTNIFEITNLVDLKNIMMSKVTVIAGFTVPSTPDKLKIFIRRFLKRTAEKFPLLTFIYMEVSDENRTTLNILKGSIEDYPKIFHIRGGNTVLVSVNSATEETVVDSFKQVEKYYINEMKQFNSNHSQTQNELLDNDLSDDTQSEEPQIKPQIKPQDVLDPKLEKKMNLEKLVILNKKSDDLKIEMVKEIAKRKKMEVKLEKKPSDDDGKEYRKSLRKSR